MSIASRWFVVCSGVVVAAMLAGAWWLWETREKLAPPFNTAVAVTDAGSLFDRLGMPRRLSEFSASRAVLVAFFSSRMEPGDPAVAELGQLAKEFHDAPVAVLAVYPDEKDSIDIMAAHAVACDLGCLVLKDKGGRFAKSLGVERVPTFCVMTGGGFPRFAGAARDETSGQAAASLAVQALLAGDPIEIPWTPTRGFPIRAARADEATVPLPTYAREVAPIVRRRCEGCHRDNGMAPFSLATLDQIRAHREMIEEVIETRRMPPWDADRRIGKFANDRDLTPEERQTLDAWLRAGCPAGDLVTSPPLPAQDRWMMGEPDVLIPAPREMEIPAEGVLEYQFVEIPAEQTDGVFQADRWVRAAEVLPSNPAVTHHVIVYVFPREATVGAENIQAAVGTFGWVPGKPFFSFPEDTALLFPKGCRLLVEMHYTPNGQASRDRPVIALRFSPDPPKRPLRVISIWQDKIAIPSRASHYPGRAAVECATDLLLWGAIPHMHARGKDFQLLRESAGANAVPLLSVPKYNFYWQTAYWFSEPISLPKGTRLVCAGHWDNSALNLNNPNPDVNVSFGMQTADEMLNAWVFVTAQREGIELPDLALLPTSTEPSPFGIEGRDSSVGGTIGGAGPRMRDFRLLEVLGSHGKLEYPPQFDGVRIVPLSAKTDQAHRIMLTSPDFPLERDRVHVITFRARAEEARNFGIQVGQAHAPWENLGLQSDLKASSEWNCFRLPFRARATEKAAWVAFFLGQDMAPIELADFRLVPTPPETTLEAVLADSWRLSLGPGVRADLRHPEFEGAVQRVVFDASTGKSGGNEPWDARLEGPPFRVAAGKSYFLTGRARAERPRSIVAVVSQAEPPSGNIGLFRRIPLIQEWRAFQLLLEAKTDEMAIPGFFLGGDDASVEMADLRLEETPRSPWTLRTADELLARLQWGDGKSTTMEPVRVSFSTTAKSKPWDAQLQRRLPPIEARRSYKIRFRARADRPRAATLTLSAAKPPFENLGLYHELQWSPEWVETALEFTATRDEADAILSFWLGQDDAEVEIADFVVE